MKLVVNKKARHEYTVEDTVEAGVVLTGAEVKSLRKGAASFAGSYVKVLNQEAYLLNAQISPYAFASVEDYDPTRTRKLLLHKKEILTIQDAVENRGRVAYPLAFELHHNKIKLLIGIGRGKSQRDKRSELRKKALQRDQERELKYS